jgi:hypothetical protein
MMNFTTIKKTTYLLALCSIFACSGSDDETIEPPVLQTDSQLLVEGSPWSYADVNVIEITEQAINEKTTNEVEMMVNGSFPGFTFEFMDNGTGSLTTPDGDSFSFNYELSGDDIVFDGIAFGSLEDFEVTEDELTFYLNQTTGDGEDPDNDVSFYGEFTYE